MTRSEYNEFNSISQYRPGTKKFKEIYEKFKPIYQDWEYKRVRRYQRWKSFYNNMFKYHTGLTLNLIDDKENSFGYLVTDLPKEATLYNTTMGYLLKYPLKNDLSECHEI